MLIWDNLNVHLRAELRAFTGAQPWLEVFQLPSYAPDLNPVEGIWSSLKRGPLANHAFTGPAHLLQVIRHGLRKSSTSLPHRRLPRRHRPQPATRRTDIMN